MLFAIAAAGDAPPFSDGAGRPGARGASGGKIHENTRRLVAAAATGLLVTLAACGSSAPNRSASQTAAASLPTPRGGPPTSPSQMAADQTMTINTFTPPSSFDPSQGGSGGTLLYVEPLLKPNRQGSDVVGAAALGYNVSADGLTYTFNLRQDGRYNNDQPVQAADFVFAWRRLVDPRVASPFQATFAALINGGAAVASLDPKKDADRIPAALDALGVKAVDPYTFQVTLAHPVPYFKWIATMAGGAPVPAAAVSQYGSMWATGPSTTVTNGAFQVSQATPGGQFTLTPNPHYRTHPYLKRIVDLALGYNTQAAQLKYQANGLDEVNGCPLGQSKPTCYQGALGQQHILFPAPTIDYIQYNTTRPPFDNAKVRLAFSQAVDRATFVKDFQHDPGSAALSSLLPPGVPGSDPSAGAAQTYNPSQARSDLAASGVAKSSLQSLHLLVGSYQVNEATFLRQQWQTNLGITVTIDSISDNSTVTNDLSSGHYDIYDGNGYSATYPDPAQWFDQFLPNANLGFGGTNVWNDPDYSRLVQQADVTSDPSRRIQLYQQAQRILVQQAPVGFFYRFDYNLWVKPWIRGLVITPSDDNDALGDYYPSTIWVAKH